MGCLGTGHDQEGDPTALQRGCCSHLVPLLQGVTATGSSAMDKQHPLHSLPHYCPAILQKSIPERRYCCLTWQQQLKRCSVMPFYSSRSRGIHCWCASAVSPFASPVFGKLWSRHCQSITPDQVAEVSSAGGCILAGPVVDCRSCLGSFFFFLNRALDRFVMVSCQLLYRMFTIYMEQLKINMCLCTKIPIGLRPALHINVIVNFHVCSALKDML